MYRWSLGDVYQETAPIPSSVPRGNLKTVTVLREAISARQVRQDHQKCTARTSEKPSPLKRHHPDVHACTDGAKEWLTQSGRSHHGQSVIRSLKQVTVDLGGTTRITTSEARATRTIIRTQRATRTIIRTQCLSLCHAGMSNTLSMN